MADVNSAELLASIDPAADHDATMAAIRKAVDSSAQDLVDRDVHTYLGDRIQQAMDGEERGLVVRVYGEDLSKIEELAKDVANKLKTTDGVSNAKVEAPAKQPRIEIEPDLEKCMAHGVKPGDVRRQAAILLSGIDVGQLFEEQKVFDVVVWGKPEIRKDFDSVKKLLIETEEKSVPLEGRGPRTDGYGTDRDQPAGRRALYRRDGRRQRPRSGSRRNGCSESAGADSIPAGIPSRVTRRPGRTAGEPEACSGLRDCGIDRNLLVAAGRLQ